MGFCGMTLAPSKIRACPSLRKEFSPQMREAEEMRSVKSFPNMFWLCSVQDGERRIMGPLPVDCTSKIQEINEIIDRYQLIHCFPEPTGPPAPIRKGGRKPPSRCENHPNPWKRDTPILAGIVPLPNHDKHQKIRSPFGFFLIFRISVRKITRMEMNTFGGLFSEKQCRESSCRLNP